MDNSPELSITVPVFNEVPANLSRVVEQLDAVLQPLKISYEIVFVDDGSKAGTNKALRVLVDKFSHVRLVVLSRNFGELAAVSAGLENARGKAVVNIDSDLQDPPALIPKMFQYYQEGYDVVLTSQETRNEPWHRQILAKWFYRILGSISSVKIPRDVGEFRLLNRRAINALALMPERTRFLRGLVPWVGMKQITIPFERASRIEGESSYTWGKLCALAFDGIVAFSDAPLYAIPIIGLVLCAAGIVAAIAFATTENLFCGRLACFAASALVFVAGIQICCIGTIALYFAHLLKEVRRRPTYIVAERLGWQDSESL